MVGSGIEVDDDETEGSSMEDEGVSMEDEGSMDDGEVESTLDTSCGRLDQ